MAEDNLTTWAEDDVVFHSDCHDWSASLIHNTAQELLSVRARFVRSGSRGQASEGAARIQPRVGIFVERRGRASETFATPFGRTSVSVSKLGVIPSRTGAEDVGLEVQASGDIIVEVVVQVST